jgi:hypothetical protein
MSSYYGTLSGANAYFDNRLHSESWNDSDPADRPKALLEATRVIDSLNYRGLKHSVWLIMYEADPSQTGNYTKILVNPPSRQDIITADATQALEFPRGQDTTVPEEIEWACYELALALIEGFDSEDAMEKANIIRQAYAAVRTTYDAGSAAMEYLVYGIPTARVWRWLKPRLVLDRTIRTSRAD